MLHHRADGPSIETPPVGIAGVDILQHGSTHHCGCGGSCCTGKEKRQEGPFCAACACVSERAGRQWVRGRAAQYGVFSGTIQGEGRPFREIISRGAFRAALSDPARHIRATIGHNEALTLAEFPGELRVWDNEDGLHFEFPVPPNDLGAGALDGLRSGRLGGCSFMMTDVSSNFAQTESGLVRRISSVGKLLDVSLVTQGAYMVQPPDPADVRQAQATTGRAVAPVTLEQAREIARRMRERQNA